MEEIWKETEISGYFISNFGRLRGRSGKIIKSYLNKHTGYYMICLKVKDQFDKPKCIKIARLVAKAFVPNPENKPYVNHIDGNKQNDVYTNLEWCTNQENVLHAYKLGLAKQKRGWNNEQAKLTPAIIEYIRKNYIPRDKEFGARALGRKFNIAHSNIVRIIENKKYNL